MAEELFNGSSGAESPRRPNPLILQDINTSEDALIYVRKQRNALWQSLKGKQPRGIANVLTWGLIVNELFAESVKQHPEFDQEKIQATEARENLVFSAMYKSLGSPSDLSTMYGSLYQYEAQAVYARNIVERLEMEEEKQNQGITVFVPDLEVSSAETDPVES